MNGIKVAAEFDELVEILRWQKSQDPDSFDRIYNKYKNTVFSHVNKYKGGNVSPDLIHAKAISLLADALETYDPKKKAGFHTHLHNRLLKLYRYVNSKQNVAYIPEHQSLHIVSFLNVRDNLKDTLGRDPSYEELADALRMDVNDVIKLDKSLVSEINIGENLDFNTFNSELEDPIQIFVWDSIPTEYKALYEAIIGVGGKEPVTKVSELAQRFDVPYNQMRKDVQKLSEVLDAIHNKYGSLTTTT